jgi:hypothetical protein
MNPDNGERDREQRASRVEPKCVNASVTHHRRR